MSKEVNLSVIVPVYNAAPFLGALIDSLLSQTYIGVMELILVNDGSTDDSLDVCQRYAASNASIKVVNQANGGVSNARNAGVSLATGDYLAFVDADDVISFDMYRVMVGALEQTGADLVSCELERIPSGQTPSQITTSGSTALYSGHRDILRAFLSEELGGVGACNKVFRRELVSNLRFSEDYKYNEDKLYLFEAISSYDQVVHVKDALYYYYERAGSATAKPISPALFDIEEVVQIVEEGVMELTPELQGDAKHSSIISLLRLYRTTLLAVNKLEYVQRIEELRGRIASYRTYDRYYRTSVRVELLVLTHLPSVYEGLFHAYRLIKSRIAV